MSKTTQQIRSYIQLGEQDYTFRKPRRFKKGEVWAYDHGMALAAINAQFKADGLIAKFRSRFHE